MFSPCLCGFTPACSHSKDMQIGVRLTGDSKLRVDVKGSVNRIGLQ